MRGGPSLVGCFDLCEWTRQKGEGGLVVGWLLWVWWWVLIVDCCISGGEEMRDRVVWFVVGNWAKFERFARIRRIGLRFEG